jgi:hypothetical protein
MIVKAKRYRTYVSLRNLGFSPGEIHCVLENNHVPEEKELKLPQGAT